MENPGKLYHATVTAAVPSIMKDGLQPIDEWVNLSTEDESSLVAFLGYLGAYDDDTEKAVDTITLLEVDTGGLSLEWPGIDGDHHFVSRETIPAERIRVVSTCTLEQVTEWHSSEPMTMDQIMTSSFFEQMAKAADAHDNRKVV